MNIVLKMNIVLRYERGLFLQILSEERVMGGSNRSVTSSKIQLRKQKIKIKTKRKSQSRDIYKFEKSVTQYLSNKDSNGHDKGLRWAYLKS